MLPEHGRIDCRRCFSNQLDKTQRPHPDWLMVNDPGAWGGKSPKYLVLGFSKGATQANLFKSGRFEDVAFAGMRTRLTRALQALDIIDDAQCVDTYIDAPNPHLAFGSLVRCSITRLNAKASKKKGQDVFSSSGSLVVKSFDEIPEILTACSRQYLLALPRSVMAVVLLGNGDAYVERCQQLIQRLFPHDFKRVNEMAVRADDRLWVHAAHPSPANGHFNKWLSSSTGPGRKRMLAANALAMTRQT